MPDGIGRYAGACLAERAVERLCAASVGSHRDDAVRAPGTGKREVAGSEVADAANRVRNSESRSQNPGGIENRDQHSEF